MARHRALLRRSHELPWAAPHRGSAAARLRLSPAAERARKLAIKQRTEVARGVRPAATYQERMALEYSSPRQIAEARAKTGTALRPRLGPQGSLHTARWSAGGFRSNAGGTVGTRRTFTGRTIRVRDTSSATRLTARGRWVRAKYD